MINEIITKSILDKEYEFIFSGTDEECDRVMWANYHSKGIFDKPKWTAIHKGKFISSETDIDFIFVSRTQFGHTKEKPHIIEYLYRHKDFNKKPDTTSEISIDVHEESHFNLLCPNTILVIVTPILIFLYVCTFFV